MARVVRPWPSTLARRAHHASCAAAQAHEETHKEVNGVKMVKIDLGETDRESEIASEACEAQRTG